MVCQQTLFPTLPTVALTVKTGHVVSLEGRTVKQPQGTVWQYSIFLLLKFTEKTKTNNALVLTPSDLSTLSVPSPSVPHEEDSAVLFVRTDSK